VRVGSDQDLSKGTYLMIQAPTATGFTRDEQWPDVISTDPTGNQSKGSAKHKDFKVKIVLSIVFY
jgi:hypothetical protein